LSDAVVNLVEERVVRRSPRGDDHRVNIREYTRCASPNVVDGDSVAVDLFDEVLRGQFDSGRSETWEQVGPIQGVAHFFPDSVVGREYFYFRLSLRGQNLGETKRQI